MPIDVACRCGKRFRARESLAGRRVKCPNCSNPLTIPANSPAPRPPPIEPELAVVALSQQLPAHCLCGRRVAVDRHHLLDVVFCDACGGVLTIQYDGRGNELPAPATTSRISNSPRQPARLKPLPSWVAKRERQWRTKSLRNIMVVTSLIALLGLFFLGAGLVIWGVTELWLAGLPAGIGLWGCSLSGFNFYAASLIAQRRNAHDRQVLAELKAEYSRSAK